MLNLWPNKPAIAHTKYYINKKPQSSEGRTNERKKRETGAHTHEKMLIRSDLKWITWCAPHRTTTKKYFRLERRRPFKLFLTVFCVWVCRSFGRSVGWTVGQPSLCRWHAATQSVYSLSLSVLGRWLRVKDGNIHRARECVLWKRLNVASKGEWKTINEKCIRGISSRESFDLRLEFTANGASNWHIIPIIESRASRTRRCVRATAASKLYDTIVNSKHIQMPRNVVSVKSDRFWCQHITRNNTEMSR